MRRGGLPRAHGLLGKGRSGGCQQRLVERRGATQPSGATQLAWLGWL